MAGRDKALHVAELLCARMLHDFSGSVGALSSLLDLAIEQPERGAEPLALANETAGQLVRRLKLLRAAWGSTMEPLTVDRVRDLALGLGQSRYTVQLDGLRADTVFSPEMGRMALNLLLLATDALPRGGEAALSGDAEDLVLTVSGARAGWPPGFAACIADPAAGWASLEDPRKVQLGMTVLLAAAFRMRLSMMVGTGAGDAVPPLRLRAG